MNSANYEKHFKVREEILFGKDAKLTKVQKLFAHTSFLPYSGMRNEEKIFFDMAQDLEAEIDKETPNRDSPDYKKFLAMKAVSISFQSSVEKSKKLLAIIALLEPFKSEPEVTLSYIYALLQFETKKENVDYFLKAEALFHQYKTNETPCLSIYEVFGALPLNQELNDIITIFFFDKFVILGNEDMQAKYVLPALNAFFFKEQIWDKVGHKPLKFETIVPELSTYIGCLINSLHFAQLDHLLSLLMFHLVKAGRAKPISLETQVRIDLGKAFISLYYASWAHKFISAFCLIATNPDYAMKNPIRTAVIRFEEFMEPGVEVYEKQFPVDFENMIEKNYDKIIKRGKLWARRSIEYFKKTETHGTGHKPMLQCLDDLLKEFDKM